MARFQAGCVGRGYEVTRLGGTGTGAAGFAAGWRGRVTVRTWAEDERDYYRVTLGSHMYSGGDSATLASGRLDAGRNPAPDVAPCLVRLLVKAVQAADALADENAARVERALALAQAADEAQVDAAAAVVRLAEAGPESTDQARALAAEVLALATRAAEIAARAVKTANRATARACTETVRARRALGHAKRMAAKLEDADTGAATVDRLGHAAYEAENEAAAALDAYIAAHGPEPETGGGLVGGGSSEEARQAGFTALD